VNVHGPPWLHSEPLNSLNFDFNADPAPTFKSNADPNPVLIQLPGIRRIYANPDLQPGFMNRVNLFEFEEFVSKIKGGEEERPAGAVLINSN
jgi:hypothetical protein